MDRAAIDAVRGAVASSFDRYVEQLQALCRLRSRRQDPQAMRATAEHIAAAIRAVGGEAALVEWEGSHPYVLGEVAGGPRRLLHFNHYDVEVEPTGDEADWIAPPYAAEVVDGALYARGVADDKAALLSRIQAIDAFRTAGVDPPVTVRFLIEGKQRLDSPGLGPLFAAHRDRLDADAALWENAWTDGRDRPLLKLGEKGILYLELTVRTLSRPLTSQNAALLPNAAWRLVAALSELVDGDGRVRIPGFDAVREASAEELALLRDVEFDVDYLTKRAGVAQLVGNPSPEEAAVRVRTLPTVTLGGIQAGNLADDVTLELPDAARAKVEIRLVPGQDPDRVLGAVQRHLAAGGFGDVTIRVLGASRPSTTDHRHPFVGLVADAARHVYGTEPVLEPYTTWIGNQGAVTGMPIVGVGVSRHDSGIDGPNEHILLADYRRGIELVIEVMAAMSIAVKTG